MASVPARLLLFVSSFFPLALIFFVLLIRTHAWFAILILIIGVLGLVGIVLYARSIKQSAPDQIRVAEIQRRDGETLNYLVTYVIPFVPMWSQGWDTAVALGIFLSVACILYVKSNMIHINPMLNLFGYHLYEITLENGGIHALVTRRRVVRGDTLRVVKAGEDILWDKAP